MEQEEKIKEAANRYADERFSIRSRSQHEIDLVHTDADANEIAREAYEAGAELVLNQKPQQSPVKTLQECKDEVAIGKYKFQSWENLIYFSDKDDIEHYSDEVAELYASQTQPAQSPWIRVSERLPDVHGLYLVSKPLCLPSTSWNNSSDMSFSDEQITHWMPLPSNPTDHDGE